VHQVGLFTFLCLKRGIRQQRHNGQLNGRGIIFGPSLNLANLAFDFDNPDSFEVLRHSNNSSTGIL